MPMPRLRPFPSGIMLAFRARALDDAIQLDGDELIEARWFTRDDLADLATRNRGNLGRSDSVDRFLLEGRLYQTS